MIKIMKGEKIIIILKDKDRKKIVLTSKKFNKKEKYLKKTLLLSIPEIQIYPHRGLLL
jgi:hypothetical protein